MPSNEEREDHQSIIYREGTAAAAELLDEEESEEEDDLVDSEDDEDEEDLAMHHHHHQPEFEEDLNSASPSTSIPLNGSVIETPSAITDLSIDHKHQQESEVPAASEDKKPAVFDDSRRLFQRLWTDEDEIGLLQGFLEYTVQRGYKNSSYYHDTGPFYDQIKTRLQVDFNKNQLVEKLRRLKKKYRNVLSRISSGKEFSFKSPHDQATFEISRKIWSGISGRGGVAEEGGLEDEEGNPQNINTEINNNDNCVDTNNLEKKSPGSRKRSRKRPAEDNLSSYPAVIEDTVRSCLSPLFKELLQRSINGPCNTGGYGCVSLNPLPLNFGINSLNTSSGEVVDEKWRKQQILELEVYLKRIKLIQDQIKSTLEELRSIRS